MSTPAAAPARRVVPRGTLAVGAGLAALGISSFGFLALAARGLSSDAFAELSVVWTVLFTLGPGLFLPLEQEVARELAAGAGGHGVLRRAAALSALLAVLLTLVTLAATSWVRGQLLGGESGLFVAMILANAALAVVHPSRGLLAGTGRFGRYGLQLGVDGVLRMVGAGVLLAAGVTDVTWYGATLVVSQLVAVGVSLLGLRRAPATVTADDERGRAVAAGSVRALAAAVGLMVVGALAAQGLANLGTLLVKAWSEPGGAAGRFLTALVLARVPLFLFAALQASLLPGLAEMFARHDLAGVRRAMTRLLAVLVVLAGLGTLVIATLGPDIAALLFGSDYRSERAPLTLLSAGSGVYLVAAAVAQLLLALRARGAYAAGWVMSVAAFAVAVALPGSLPIRVSVAFLIGSGVALVWFALALRRAWRAHPASGPGAVATPVTAADVAP